MTAARLVRLSWRLVLGLIFTTVGATAALDATSIIALVTGLCLAWTGASITGLGLIALGTGR